MKALVFGFLAASALAFGANETFEWKGSIAPGQTLEIKGVNGDVVAEPSATSMIELVANKSGRRNDPSQVRIEVVPHSGGITICAVYPSDDGRNECRPGSEGRMNVRDNDVSVDFRIKIPRQVVFHGKTVNGRVEASGLDAGVEAHTVNGKIAVSTKGTVEAKTVNGSIEAVCGAMPDRDLKFATVNGSVDLTLPRDARADLQASTVNGGINSDFPVTVQGRFGPKSVNGKLNGGGRMLKIATVNGSIRLRQGS